MVIGLIIAALALFVIPLVAAIVYGIVIASKKNK